MMYVNPGRDRILLVILLAATIFGCGSVNGQEYQPMPPSATKSVIYIYRPWHFYASGTAPMITCGQDSIELEAGGYHTFYNDAGSIECSAVGSPNAALKFTADLGRSYYVREEIKPEGVHLAAVDPDIAKNEITSCRLQSVASAPTPPQQ
jgi:hypothetical protein